MRSFRHDSLVEWHHSISCNSICRFWLF